MRGWRGPDEDAGAARDKAGPRLALIVHSTRKPAKLINQEDGRRVAAAIVVPVAPTTAPANILAMSRKDAVLPPPKTGNIANIPNTIVINATTNVNGGNKSKNPLFGAGPGLALEA